MRMTRVTMGLVMPENRENRPARLHLFPNIAAALAGAALVGSILLWFASHRPGGLDWGWQGPGYGRLVISSRDGRMVIGLDDAQPDSRLFWWSSRRTRGLADLINDDDRWMSADLWCWGVAAPHWIVGALLCIPIVWRWLVWRDRAEELHRREHGLCRHCGYDVRASVERCPECGMPIAARGAANT